MSLFPMFLKLNRRPCLIVGAGRIALEKIESLLPTGAALHVVAPGALPQIQDLAAEGRLTWTAREYQTADLDGVFVVIAATATAAVNHAVYEEAARRGILCNAVDDPPFCDFYFGSIVRRGDLQIAISTNGDSPSLSQRLRREIDAQLPQDLGGWLAQLGSLRREVLAHYPAGDGRKQLLYTLAQRSLCEAAECPTRKLAFAMPAVTNTAEVTDTAAVTNTTAVTNEFGAVLDPEGERISSMFAESASLADARSSAGAAAGKVYLIGAGPGDPELLTLKAARLLASAEVVLHDDLVPEAIVSLAAPRAWVLNVGKRCGAKSITQDEINRLMIDFAQRGLAVVRLKSGDPLVFGRAGEEIEALRSANVPFEVVPGITAAFAAAAALQCSLTDRRSASTVVFSTGHHAQSTLDDSRPPAEEDATRIVYMPGRDLHSLAAEWLGEGLSPDLPCVVISRAALPGQHTRCARLAELGELTPGAAPNLLLAGWALRGVHSSADQLLAAVDAAIVGGR